MRVMTLGPLVVVAVTLAGPRAFGQEAIAAPAPLDAGSIAPSSGVPNGDATHSILSGSSSSPSSSADNAWRYRWYDGRWWYWTQQNRWMWYNDQRQWVDFNARDGATAARPYTAAYGSYPQAPVHGSPGSNYPGAAPYPRVYPRPAVGVPPYGGVSLGAGRAGVNVWGAHGSVQFGRFGIGW
jgi:hypothetical protein